MTDDDSATDSSIFSKISQFSSISDGKSGLMVPTYQLNCRYPVMELTKSIPGSKLPCFSNPKTPTITQINSFSFPIFPTTQTSLTFSSHSKTHINLTNGENTIEKPNKQLPTMTEIMEASKAQNLHLQLQTVGPFFRITAKSLKTQNELGKTEGLIRVWLNGKILHLDSIRLQKETLRMEKSIFGIGLFIGAVAIRHGYDCGCTTAVLLAINDSDLYHSKLVRYYGRIGFKVVDEVKGSSIGDMADMLVWGGVGTRMGANVEDLLVKWCTKFTPN